jgi:L-threonylcarbamoyladenylate synthase
VTDAPPPRLVDATALDVVARCLDHGGVVALPTDTVYGLAARLDRPAAIAAIFDIKGRPGDLALPVLCESPTQAAALAAPWPETARRLAEAFWPGPLTLVVATGVTLGRLVGGDGHSVGLRCPDHAFVRALCAMTGALAVTSANPHGQAPATTAEEVLVALGSTAVALVVDGGRCAAPPSAIVDCRAQPALLREGSIPWARLLEEAEPLP